MFPFLRNIRQRLFTENRFCKYLLYAIREIVPGVNDWNKTPKKQEQAFLYLLDRQ